MALKPIPLARMSWAITAAGLGAALIEMVFVLPIQTKLGNSPQVVFQSIAAGLLGRGAFQGGIPAAALGAVIHLVVSLVAAKVYILAAWRWDDVLLRRPVVCGLVFGVVVYVVMTFVVIPLSALGFTPPRSLPLLWASLATHILAFGLPIGLVASALMRSGGPVRAANPRAA
jgi:hypothetical protein